MFIKRLISFFAPYSCLSCGQQGAAVCANCLDKVVIVKSPTCFSCNAQSPGFKTCKRCRSKSSLRGVNVASHYEGDIKRLIGLLKYHNGVDVAPVLAQLMAQGANKPDFITAVPTSPRRFRQRGYNQAALLAKALANTRGVPYLETLGRLGNGRQVGANRRVRQEQMAGNMFAINKTAIKGANVLVVDDVITTGATLSEAARALKAAGAKSVWGAVVAKH